MMNKVFDAVQPLWTLLLLLFGIVPFLLIGLIVYIYVALALKAIAKKTKTKQAWLAWIPIANVYLLIKIGGAPPWTLLLLLLGIVPFIGQIVSLGLVVYWWWLAAEACKRPGWWGIMMLIPIVNFVVIGMLAWGK